MLVVRSPRCLNTGPKITSAAGSPVLTEQQREEIRACFADDLQTHLRDRLVGIANAHYQAGQPDPGQRTLHVLCASMTATAAEVRGWFQWFGHATDFVHAPGSASASVTFSDADDARDAYEHYRAPEHAHLIRRMELEKTSGPQLSVNYPAGSPGEFDVQDPAMRAAVEMLEMLPTSTYATVLIKISGELSDADKAKLEEDKIYVLGSALAPRISIAYDLF
ncbi:hypothetical protein PG994_012617 [Apiospora phragmitis]|uniref:Uncharacterized protein n=1 Tax=Apiospora phragmitis TaxID=2905665 RepID=A0ABR1TAZ4_9PEZI